MEYTLGKRLVVLGVLALSLTVSAWRIIKRKVRKQKSHKITVWHFLFLFFHAGYLFLQMEQINNPVWVEMHPGYMALNIVVIFGFLLLLALLLNSFRAAMTLGTIFFFAFTLVFYFVYQFRGEPFQFIDLFSVKTAMEVAGDYEFTVTEDIMYAAAISLGSILLYAGTPRCMFVRTKKWKIRLRGIASGAVAVLFFCYLNLPWNGGLGIVTNLYRPYKTYQEYGTTVGFFCVAKYMRLTPPDGYSVSEVEKLAKTMEVKDEESSDKVIPTNIIVIMNESWADYRMLGDFEVNEPYMPFYDSLTENTIKGHTLVSIRGGGTAKPEYEFLTGNSVKRFPGMVPYVSYFTHEQYSIVTTLKAQGYRAEAMHPNKGTNWKRTSAYRLLQFDEFYTITDFDATAERIRSYVSDQANYEKILKQIKEKEDQAEPYFLFDVTMQNHGGYTTSPWRGDIETIGYREEAVNQYLSLQKETDEALEYLVTSLQKLEEPTILLMFGDHYPDLPESFTEWITGKTYEESTLEEQQKYYATPFLIWANYDIPEKEEILTSTNYLSTLLLEQTGLKLTPYNRYLQKLQEEMPALNHLGYVDADGNYVSWEDCDEEHEKLELQYEAIQYNELAEKNRRVDEFFTISE